MQLITLRKKESVCPICWTSIGHRSFTFESKMEKVCQHMHKFGLEWGLLKSPVDLKSYVFKKPAAYEDSDYSSPLEESENEDQAPTALVSVKTEIKPEISDSDDPSIPFKRGPGRPRKDGSHAWNRPRKYSLICHHSHSNYVPKKHRRTPSPSSDSESYDGPLAPQYLITGLPLELRKSFKRFLNKCGGREKKLPIQDDVEVTITNKDLQATSKIVASFLENVPIVDVRWVEDSIKAKKILNVNDYLLVTRNYLEEKLYIFSNVYFVVSRQC